MALEYMWKDVFQGVRLGFSPKKIWVAAKGLLMGTIGYSILAYLSLMASGWDIQKIWLEFRYIPFPFFQGNLTWFGWIIWAIAGLWVLYFYFITMTAISKITYEQLRGDEFYESKEAWTFAHKNWKGTFLSPIYLIFFIAALILTGLILGLVGRIPTVGQILIGLSAVPIFAGALFVVYLTIVVGVILISAPAIVATTESDTFDTLFEGFSLINDQTWRYILWEVILLITTFIGIIIFAWLFKYALSLTHHTLIVWAGPRNWWNIMWHNANWYLHIPWLPIWIAKWYPTFFVPTEFISAGSETLAQYPGAATTFGGFLLGLSFYMVIFIIIGYGISTHAAGQTLIYTILVKIKDEKDLLVKEEKLFEAEIEEKEEEVEVGKKEKKQRRKEENKEVKQ